MWLVSVMPLVSPNLIEHIYTLLILFTVESGPTKVHERLYHLQSSVSFARVPLTVVKRSPASMRWCGLYPIVRHI